MFFVRAPLLVAATCIAACSTTPTLEDGGADGPAMDRDVLSMLDVSSADRADEGSEVGATDSGPISDATVGDTRLGPDATLDDATAASDGAITTEAGSMDSGPDARSDGAIATEAGSMDSGPDVRSDGAITTEAGSMDTGVALDARSDGAISTDALADSGPDALADSGPDVRCPGTQTLCGDRCVDTQSDLMNCGRCANACPPPPSGTAACLAGRCGAAPGTQMTQLAGGATAIELGQPALAVTMVVSTSGIFPTRVSAPGGTALGMVHLFGGNFAPNGAPIARGQTLTVASNTALFSLLGTTYGGDGRVTFALPDLQDRFLVGPGTGPGLPDAPLGAAFGSREATLSLATMPAHAHLLVDGVTRTSPVGGGAPLDVRAPSLPVTAWVATEGTFPVPDGAVSMPFLGQIRWFAGNFTPSEGWVPADGRSLPIASNMALFTVLGTTYGGDGRTTFAVPDLRGRVPVGTGMGPGLPTIALAQTTGASSTTLTSAQLPTHAHGLFGGGSTQTAGDSQPISAYQPSLGITWLVSTTGVYPSRDGGGSFDDSVPFIAEIIAFAGSFAPRGFASASGQVLAIASNAALFSLLGTQYGGDGRSTFALPDLRGRAPIGASATLPVGATRGAPLRVLGAANLPAHSHTY